MHHTTLKKLNLKYNVRKQARYNLNHHKEYQVLQCVFLIRKNDGNHRVLIDLSRLNSICVTTVSHMPRIHDILHKMKDSPFLSSLDLANGYFAIPLTEESKKLTAFSTAT